VTTSRLSWEEKAACKKYANGRGNPDVVITCFVDLGRLITAPRRTFDGPRCLARGYHSVKVSDVDVYAVYEPERVRILSFKDRRTGAITTFPRRERLAQPLAPLQVQVGRGLQASAEALLASAICIEPAKGVATAHMQQSSTNCSTLTEPVGTHREEATCFLYGLLVALGGQDGLWRQFSSMYSSIVM